MQEESVYKIKEFNFIEQKDLKEEDVLEMVKLGPVVAFIDDYASLHKYKSVCLSPYNKWNIPFEHIKSDHFFSLNVVLVGNL